jgi:hypothetical protein
MAAFRHELVEACGAILENVEGEGGRRVRTGYPHGDDRPLVGGRGVRFIYLLLGVVVREGRKTHMTHLKRCRCPSPVCGSDVYV